MHICVDTHQPYVRRDMGIMVCNVADRVGIRMQVHRLDEATGGLLLVAKTRLALQGLSSSFEQRQVSHSPPSHSQQHQPKSHHTRPSWVTLYHMCAVAKCMKLQHRLRKGTKVLPLRLHCTCIICGHRPIQLLDQVTLQYVVHRLLFQQRMSDW